jgi:hypothetical protein
MAKLSVIYHQAYQYLESYLDNLNLPETGKEILEGEFEIFRKRQPFSSLSEVNRRMLESLKNRSGFPNYIGEDTVAKSEDILFGYNPKIIRERYEYNWDKLLDEFQKHIEKARNTNRSNNSSSWVQFSKGVLSCAKYLSQFNDAVEFDKYVKSFTNNDYSIVVLPLIMSEQIDGFGFALACDFLKESGYQDFCKPDVHLMKIFDGVGIVENDNSPYLTFVKMVEMAREVKQPPVIIDKLFWLIGSGKFEEYNRTHAEKIMIHRMRDDFVIKSNTKKGVGDGKRN